MIRVNRDDDLAYMLTLLHVAERVLNSCSLKCLDRSDGPKFSLPAELHDLVQDSACRLRLVRPKLRVIEAHECSVILEAVHRQLGLADQVSLSDFDHCAKLGNAVPRFVK